MHEVVSFYEHYLHGSSHDGIHVLLLVNLKPLLQRLHVPLWHVIQFVGQLTQIVIDVFVDVTVEEKL